MLKNLLKIKSIITLVMLGIFAYLAVTQAIPPEISLITVTSVLTYYFVKKDEKE